MLEQSNDGVHRRHGQFRQTSWRKRLMRTEPEISIGRCLALHSDDLPKGRERSLHVGRHVLERCPLHGVFDKVAGKHGVGSQREVALEG